MRNAGNYNHEENSKFYHSLKRQKNNNRADQEDMIHAKKKHQSHRRRNKGRHFSERETLYTLPGDDYTQYEQL